MSDFWFGKKSRKCGRIHVICGSMFSGKTTALISSLNRAKNADLLIQAFKPIVDNRYDKEAIVSHDSAKIEAVAVSDANELLAKVHPFTDIIGIDEAQFFDHQIIGAVKTLADHGKDVVVAGLDMDFQGLPFGPMPALICIAEYVTKCHGICVKCKQEASFTQRLTANSSQIQIGGREAYEARCRSCHEVHKSDSLYLEANEKKAVNRS